MTLPSDVFITLGSLLLLGLLAGALGRRLHVPRVILLLLLGLLLGPAHLNFIVESHQTWMNVLAQLTLAMVVFSLGGKLTWEDLTTNARLILWFSAAGTFITATLVFLGLHLLLSTPVEIALLLAGIATAPAPAVTVDIVRELRADGRFTRAMLGIVGISDAMALMVFSLAISLIHAMNGSGSVWAPLLEGGWEIVGGIGLGAFFGLILTLMLTRHHTSEFVMVQTLGGLLLCSGLAMAMHASFLLAALVMGMLVTNLARFSVSAFRAIDKVILIFTVLLFLFAGSSLQPSALLETGWLGGVYVLLRTGGRFLGGWVAGKAAGADDTTCRQMSQALLPQAGVALGMALISAQRFPHLADIILPVVISSIILFELVGPVFIRRAIISVQETGLDRRKMFLDPPSQD